MENIFQSADYPDLLVGLDSPDDAAVWLVDEQRALVMTTDFFTPVVDDAYDYGAIAAANSLSDVYAMGGQPFLALNIAALPPDLPLEISSEIVRGGAEKAREAGVVIAGGHTIQDKEPKFGLVVIGWVDPHKMLTKNGARPGDLLVLTKPLSFGVVTTAMKQQKALPEEEAEVIGWMKQLNRGAAGLALEFGLHAGTDITGFSLLGHALEMANASKLGLRFDFEAIPILESALRCAKMGYFPGGAFNNLANFGEQVRYTRDLTEYEELILFDPQTSGGLLLCVPPEKIDAFMARAAQMDQPAWVIGEAREGSGIEVG